MRSFPTPAPPAFAVSAARAAARAAALAAALAAAMLVGQSAPAMAQELAVDPDAGPIRDFDEDKENYSEFWERALSPAAGTYEDLVAQAQGIISSRNLAGANEARTLLGDAIASRPRAGLAHFWLGILEWRSKNFGPCAASLEKALAVEPDFVAPSDGPGLKRHWVLEYRLALCSALSGRAGAAAAHLTRVLAKFPSCSERASSTCSSWQVSWRLGEVLMALGRLEEAIDHLRVAVGSRGGDLAAKYALAIALERDEQVNEASKLLDAVSSGDYRMRSLWAAGKQYIPEEDEFYYRGLVRKHKGQAFRSRIMFRAYLKAAPRSVWRSRANAHLAEVAKVKIGDGTRVEGSAQINMKQAVAAVGAARDRFASCVAKTPSQLFQVNLALRLTAAATRPRRAKTTRIITVQHYDLLNVQHESTKIIGVTRCLRQVAQTMAVPGVTGAAAAKVSLIFNVAH